MNKIRYIIITLVWILATCYLLPAILLHIPAIQNYVGREVAAVVAKKLGTDVTVQRVDVGFFNRLVIDGVAINDQQNHPMFRATRMAAKIDLLSLLNGRIRISSTQIFGLDARLYQKAEGSAPNYQFVIDSLSSKDNDKPSQIDLVIHSIVVRNGNLRYDRWWKPQTTQINPNHLRLSHISGHFELNSLTPNDIDAAVKKLSFQEQSGLSIENLSFALKADKQKAVIRQLCLCLPHSTLSFPNTSIRYQAANGSAGKTSFQMESQLAESHITLSDLAFYVPQLKQYSNRVSLQTQIKWSASSLELSRLRVNSKDLLSIKANVQYSPNDTKKAWGADIQAMRVNIPKLDALITSITHGKTSLPPVLTRFGYAEWTGKISQQKEALRAQGKLKTDVGNADVDVNMCGKQVALVFETEGMELGRILDNSHFGKLAASVHAQATIPNKLHELQLAIQANVPTFDFKGYRYQNISIKGNIADDVYNGLLSLDDPNGHIRFEGKASGILSYLEGNKAKQIGLDANLSANQVHLKRLQITDALGNRTFSFKARANGEGISLNNLNGVLDVDNFSLHQPGEKYQLAHLHIDTRNNLLSRSLTAHTDFARLDIQGQYDYATIWQSLQNIVARYLPSLSSRVQLQSQDHFTLSLAVSDATLLQQALHLPLTLHEPIIMEGNIDGYRGNMTISAPDFSYNSQRIKGTDIHLLATDSLKASFLANHVGDNNKSLTIKGEIAAKENHMKPTVCFSMNGGTPVQATLNADVAFNRVHGKLVSNIHLNPSYVVIDTIPFNVLPSDITYSQHHLDIDHFEVSNNKQLININGQMSGSTNDSLRVTLKNIDVPYVLDILNFHSVAFDGTASGTAYVKKLFSSPRVQANLQVNDFQFEGGDMGTLHAKVLFNNGRIDINAIAKDGEDSHTDIGGYVSIKNNYIDLPIHANNSRINFIQTYTKSFMDSVDLRGDGWVRVIGPLNKVNLVGDMRATGAAHIAPLNTTYHMQQARVRLVPNEITFMNDTIRDRDGNFALLTGAIHHQALRKLTYDISIEAHDLLAYNNPVADLTSSFWGRVYASGICDIHGKAGETIMNIEATPSIGSFIEYNAVQQGAVGNQEFIQWNSPVSNIIANTTETKDSLEDVLQKESSDNTEDIPSDLHINFLVNANPNFTLRVLMDAASGDNISLIGNGVIRASWFNKGAFQMFGNYDIVGGSYDVTIQNIIKRSFMFQPGSLIAFGGDPYDASLDLKAQYVLNGVSLSDLQLGNSFKSNNIRVNCLMDIDGTPALPKVTFGLDLPTLSADAQQMVRSVINSQEDMNQQVLYLLAVGRFYTQGANNAMLDQQAQSQASLAMQGLLSGTLSQQISTVLSNVIKSNKWSFGANISTGDEGFSNAEYEGLLDGRLLNNRLLINGEFGYRDNATTDNASFIGDFDVRYLFTPNGNLAVHFYNQNNDRYFTRNSLTTQGVGLIIKKDFGKLHELFKFKRSTWTRRSKGNKKDKQSKVVKP